MVKNYSWTKLVGEKIMKIIGFIPVTYDGLSLSCIVWLPSLNLKVVLVVYLYKKGTCAVVAVVIMNQNIND